MSLRTLAVAALLTVSGAALAQPYPSKPIRMIVTFAAGGGADYVARTLGPVMSERLGQPIVVENRAGANGAIGAEHVARSAPDGYTLVLAAQGTVAVAPHLTKMPFDTFRDFAPVGLIATSPFVVSVHPDVPANSLRDLIGLAKAQAGKLNYGSSGTGGSPHLAGELFASMAGVKMVHIPYKGLGPAITDLLGGQIQVVFADVGLVVGHLRSGKLKGLALTGTKRSTLLPDVPTVAEAGVPSYAAGTWYALLAPAGTPGATVARLSEEAAKAIATPEVSNALVKQGFEPSSSTPEELVRFLRDEHAKWGKLIQNAGIKLE